MQRILLLAVLCLLAVNALAQSKKKMDANEIRAVVEQALSEDRHVTVKLEAPVQARTDGWGKKQLSKISGKIVGVQDEYFVIQDKSLLLGNVRAEAHFDNVVTIKKQPKVVRALQKTGEVTAFSGIVAVVTPPLIGAYLLHFASGGKIIIWGMAPK